MFQHDPEPLGSVWLSALVALLPLVAIFVTLGALRWKAHWAGLAALVVAVVVAVAAFGMPVHLALLSATEGAVFGLFPIMWIVFTAIWLYQLTVAAGRFEDLRAAFGLISDDPRVQAIIIAFCFGGLLEALAGFGAPVAITGVMLMALGFSPVRAAVVVLLANTAPVAFGAVGTPIITAGTLTGIPYDEIGAVVGHQTPVLAVVVPTLLVLLVDGRRGVRQVWPVALVIGLAFALAQWLAATYLSVELTDIVASLAGLAAGVLLLRFWQPRGDAEARETLRIERTADAPVEEPGGADGGRSVATEQRTLAERSQALSVDRLVMAFAPYLLIIVVFSVAKLVGPVTSFLSGTDVRIGWPGLDGQVLGASGDPVSTTVYSLQWLSSPGSLLLICGIGVAALYRLSPATAVREFTGTAYRLRFAFLSPILGWLGTAVTGSDTSANALFATLQQTAAERAGLDPHLMVAANTSGGVVGKMISPQNLTIAATAVGIAGRESELFRRTVLWSVGLLAVLCVLVFLQSTPVLGWMLPTF